MNTLSLERAELQTVVLRKVLSLLACMLLVSCSLTPGNDDEHNITSKFNSTWNIYEGIVRNSDGSITYYALPWGGLVAGVKERNMPADWSRYESIRFEFAEPTKVATQIMVSDKIKTWGKEGITSLTCFFDGYDLKAIDEVALQASDTTAITVKSVILTEGTSNWEATPLWKGNCEQGNWANGFVVSGDKFNDAYEGDKLEFVFTTDKSNPDVSYWLIKTIYNGTDQTLEGNDNELNKWGCASMGKESTRYRIILTNKDIQNLKKEGMFVNGYYNNITQCNLLKRVYTEEEM